MHDLLSMTHLSHADTPNGPVRLSPLLIGPCLLLVCLPMPVALVLADGSYAHDKFGIPNEPPWTTAMGAAIVASLLAGAAYALWADLLWFRSRSRLTATVVVSTSLVAWAPSIPMHLVAPVVPLWLPGLAALIAMDRLSKRSVPLPWSHPARWHKPSRSRGHHSVGARRGHGARPPRLHVLLRAILTVRSTRRVRFLLA